jgi:ribosome maturation factor RimP
LLGRPDKAFFGVDRNWSLQERVSEIEQRPTAATKGLSRTSEGKAAEVERLIAPSLEAMGFEIVRIQLTGNVEPTLQIMAERADGSMTVDDCVEISHTVSAILDVEDPIASAYELEVSSPGIDRPLTRLKDYERFAGFEARAELETPIEGRKRFRGRIVGVEDEEVVLDDVEGEVRFRLPFRRIARAKLILTDDLVAASTG